MYKNERKIWITITSILLILLIFAYFSPVLKSMGVFTPKNEFFNKLQNVLNVVEKNYYVNPGTEEELYIGAAKGIIEKLNDPYSSYLTQQEIKDRIESLQGKFGGIGAWVGYRDGYVIIIKPIKGYPAYKAGLLPYDKIIEVDGINVVGKSLEKVVSLLKGDPGKEVKILIKREGVDEPLSFTIIRQVIEIQFVKWGKIDNNVGYIKIEQFGDNADRGMKEALEQLIDRDKVKGLIFDLRGNPGGYLDVVLNILDMFFDKRLLVYTEGRNKTFNKKYYSTEVKFVPDNIKIVVLVDQGSASASEIFTGVMKDYGRATIMGTKTFGKGLVQQIFNLPDRAAVILTVSQYFTPKGYQINHKGIEPDIIVEPIKLSDSEKLKVSILIKDKYIEKFVKKYGKKYSEKEYQIFKNQLKTKNLLINDFYLKKLIFNEITKDDVDMLYNLTYDTQLKAAFKQIKKILSKK